jgi:hypothetical protein
MLYPVELRAHYLGKPATLKDFDYHFYGHGQMKDYATH